MPNPRPSHPGPSPRSATALVLLLMATALAGPGAAQERIYVGRLNPPGIHTLSFELGSFVVQPDGGSPLAPTAEVWGLAATDHLLLVGSAFSSIGLQAVTPDGVVLPAVENAAAAGSPGTFVIGDHAVLAGGQPAAVGVVDLDPASFGFLSQLPGALELGATPADGAALSPDGRFLYVVRTQIGSAPDFEAMVDQVDLTALPALSVVGSYPVPTAIGFDRRANRLHSFSLGGKDYLMLFRRDLQFLELDSSTGAPTLVFTLSSPNPVSGAPRRFYDAVVDQASERAVAVTDAWEPGDTALAELVAIDLSALGDPLPDVTTVAQTDLNDPATLESSGDQFLGRSGSTLFHLTNASLGPTSPRLLAYDLAPVLAGAGDIPRGTVVLAEHGFGASFGGALGLLVRDRVTAAAGPAIADATNPADGSRLFQNDLDRTVRIAGTTLGSVRRAFLGSAWLQVDPGAVAAGQVDATVSGLTPAGNLELGVVDASQAVATFSGVRVVNPTSYLPATVGYVSTGNDGGITVINAASETEVTQSFDAQVRGTSAALPSRDGKLLFVAGFRDTRIAYHCLVAEAVPGCGWNDFVDHIPLVGILGASLVLDPARDLLFVNTLWPSVDVIDTAAMPPALVASVYHSTFDDAPFRGLPREIAFADGWLYMSNDRDPHLLAVDTSGLSGDIPATEVVEVSIPGLAGVIARSDGIAVHPDGSKLYFTNLIDTAIRIFTIDPGQIDATRLAAAGTIPIPGGTQDTRHLALRQDGCFLYASARNAGATDIFQLAGAPGCPAPPASCAATPCHIATAATGANSNRVRLSPSGELVFVAALGADRVTVIDARDGSPTQHQVITVTGTGPAPGDVGLTEGIETESGADVPVTPAEGVEMTFDEVTEAGSTTVTSANVSDVPLPADFAVAGGTTPVYYDVNTTATFVGLVRLCFDYDDAGMTLPQEEGLRLLHEETCSALLAAAGASGCTAGTLGTDVLTDWSEFTCTAAGVSKGDCTAGQEGTTQVAFITQLPVDTAGNQVCGKVGSFSQFVAAVAVLPVEIDVKPGVSPNVIKLGSKGYVSAAVLSTPTFDATQVNPDTATLAGAAVRQHKKKGAMATITDVDADGDDDLLMQFPTRELALSAADSEIELRAIQFDGVPVRGADAVQVMP